MDDSLLRVLLREGVDRARDRVRVPDLFPGTVASVTGTTVMVRVDGDIDPIEVGTVIGIPPVGDRVMILFYPPAGALIFGRITDDQPYEVFDWEPTYTNLTVGDGVVTARYSQVGKQVTAAFLCNFGTTSAVAGAVTVSLPVAAETPLGAIGLHRCATSIGTAWGPVVTTTTTTVTPMVWTASGTYVQQAALSATVPGTWSDTSTIFFHISYNAA